MTERVAAIVLAGGRSSRFGRDKLAEPIDGRPMLDHVVDSVRAVAMDVVVVTSPEATPALPPEAWLVHDERAFEGPLAGLATGLAALDPSLERVIVVGADMPSLVPAVLRRLIDSLDRHEAAVLADEAVPRPLPMAVRRSAAGMVVMRLVEEGERSLRALLTQLDTDVIPQSIWRRDDPNGVTLRDVDTPSDL